MIKIIYKCTEQVHRNTFTLTLEIKKLKCRRKGIFQEVGSFKQLMNYTSLAS